MATRDSKCAAVILVLLGTGCSPESGEEDDVGSATRAATAVTWASLVKASATPQSNDLTKTGSQDLWNAGAISVQTIDRRGYVEFSTAENNKAKAAGLGSGNDGATLQDIDFAIYLHDDGSVTVSEAGTNRGSFGTYVAGDVFRVDVTNGVVTYSKNGAAPFYNSTVTPIFPLVFDTSLRSLNATIRDVTMTTPPAVTWSSPVKVSATPQANDLIKTGTQNLWNAGAISGQTIERRGYVEFTTAENTLAKVAGLGSGNAGATLEDIEFGIYLHDDTSVTVSEAGTNRGSFGNYVAGDVFRIDVKSGKVSYSKNGAPPFYTSQVTPTFPLVFDTSLRSPNATIRDVTMTTTRLHVATQESKLPPGRLSCGQSDVVVLNGKYLLEEDDPDNPAHNPPITFGDFLLKTQPDVEGEIQNQYLAVGQPGAGMDTFDGYLVLDIERPGPRGLYNHSDSDKNKIVDAYIRRIKAARAKFPNAKIGLYSTLNPDETGNAQGPLYAPRLAALIEAGKSGTRWGFPAVETGGLYTNLQFLVPILYVRFGCDVSGGPCDTAWDTRLDLYTKLGVTGSQKLESSLPLLPLLTVYVHQEPQGVVTSFHTWMLMNLELTNPTDPIASLGATIGAQLDILAENNVVDAAMWIGTGANYTSTDELTVGEGDNDGDPPPGHWTIDNYACGI